MSSEAELTVVEVIALLAELTKIIGLISVSVTVSVSVFAAAFENTTVPKSANGTKESPSSKSSTIHSALICCKCAAVSGAEMTLLTVTPVETFSIVAVPEEELAATTERVITFPAAIGMPVKSVEARGNHSNQASKDIAPLEATLKSTPVCKMAFCAVSPSIPTQAEAAEEPVAPVCFFGVGTVKVPTTEVKVCPLGGA